MAPIVVRELIMAKRIFSLVFSTILLFSATGIGLYIHTCSQEGILISFFDQPQCICSESLNNTDCTADSNCCTLPITSDQDTDEKPCCQDDYLLIANEAEQVRNQQLLFSSDQTEFTTNSWFPFETNKVFELTSSKYYPRGKAPPSIINRYLVFCSLLC